MRFSPEKFFLVVAPVLYLLYSLFCPPFQIPDDYNHFYRAYQVSEGHFFAERKDNRVGGEMPVSFEDFTLFYKTFAYAPEQRLRWNEFKKGFDLPISKKTIFKDFPNSALYSPVSYVPHAVAMLVLRKMDCSVGTIYYGGRIAAFLLWYLCMFFALRLLPGFKWLFTILFLLPMQLYLVSSYSADAMTALLAFLLIAIIFKLAFGDKTVTIKQLILVLLICGLLLLTKVLYVLLFLTIVIIPSRNFGSAKRKILSTLLLGAVLAVFSVTWTSIIFDYRISYAEYNPDFSNIATVSHVADYTRQKDRVSQQPSLLFSVVYNTLVEEYPFFLGTYAGRFGAYVGIPFASWMIIVIFVILFVTAINDAGEIKMKWWQRLILIFVAGLLFVAIVLSQYLIWSGVGTQLVTDLQGRYFIPVFPLILCACGSSLLNRKRLPFVFMGSTVFMNGYALKLLFANYVKENYGSYTSFTTSFEDHRTFGFYSTSQLGIFLQASASDSISNPGRTGKNAILLSSYGDINCICPVSDFKQGDLFEIDIWKKGDGGQIIVSGCGDDCEEFYLLNELPLVEDDNGWYRLNMIFTMPHNCSKGRGVIYLRNNTGGPVLFDDMSILIKSGKLF